MMPANSAGLAEAHKQTFYQDANPMNTALLIIGDLFLRKTTPDAFLRTPLEQILNEFGVKHVVVCGYASEFCVDTTVRRAAALGYGVTLAADAHTTCDKPHASGAAIRAHENGTLPNITSFGPVIRAIPSEKTTFAG
jgi:nicotinamidase-related amidase